MAEVGVGSVVDGRYSVLSKIGGGGMADVWLAEDTTLQRRIALKVLHPRLAQDREFVMRFQREAESAAGLQHPNVVAVFDRGDWEGTYYIAMQYVEGPTLKQLIDSGITVEQAVAQLRAAKPDEAVVRFAEIADRNAAEALKGTELFVPREALPAAEADEFYHADLVGLRAEDEEGRVLGTVAGVHNFGAGDVIELVRADGDTVMLPFTREVVPVIEIEAGRVIIAAPEDVEAETKGSVE